MRWKIVAVNLAMAAAFGACGITTLQRHQYFWVVFFSAATLNFVVVAVIEGRKKENEADLEEDQ